MIDREQLARVLDPLPWQPGAVLENPNLMDRRIGSLNSADRLLSDPRWAVVELPEPTGTLGRVPSWDLDHFDASLKPQVTPVDHDRYDCVPGPTVSIEFMGDDFWTVSEARGLAAAILAACRAAAGAQW